MQMLFVKLAAGLVAALVLLSSTLFILPQTQQALILQFGEIKRVVKKPGLHAKLPFIHSVLVFDTRILEFAAQPAEFRTKNRETELHARRVVYISVSYMIYHTGQCYQAAKHPITIEQ